MYHIGVTKMAKCAGRIRTNVHVIARSPKYTNRPVLYYVYLYRYEQFNRSGQVRRARLLNAIVCVCDSVYVSVYLKY